MLDSMPGGPWVRFVEAGISSCRYLGAPPLTGAQQLLGRVKKCLSGWSQSTPTLACMLRRCAVLADVDGGVEGDQHIAAVLR